LILLISGLATLPPLPRKQLCTAITDEFTSTPLLHPAVLTVSVLVQIMTITGVRG